MIQYARRQKKNSIGGRFADNICSQIINAIDHDTTMAFFLIYLSIFVVHYHIDKEVQSSIDQMEFILSIILMKKSVKVLVNEFDDKHFSL